MGADEERSARGHYSTEASGLSEIPAPYRGNMSVSDILDGMERIDQNAADLLEDARLMFDNGRYPRAASLAVLALEEHAKRSLLVVYRLISEDPKLRKRFWREYRDHKAKSSFLVRRLNFFGRVSDEREPELTRSFGEWADFVKQCGFYADCYQDGGAGHHWATPSEAVGREVAEWFIDIASKTIRAESEKSAAELRALRERLLLASSIAQQEDPAQSIMRLLAAAREEMEELGQEETLRKFDDYVDRKTSAPSSEGKSVNED